MKIHLQLRALLARYDVTIYMLAKELKIDADVLYSMDTRKTINTELLARVWSSLEKLIGIELTLEDFIKVEKDPS